MGGYPTPGASTFRRLMAHINADALETIFLQVQEQIRGPAPAQELIVLDGKEPRHGGGHSVLRALTVPGQHYLGSAIVDTQTQTARELVLEHGADFLLSVKDNQPPLRTRIEKPVAAPPADFPPSPGPPDAGRQA
jgi:hypothetical protein